MMKCTPYNIAKEHYEGLQKICPLNSYRRIANLKQIPVPLPSGLIDKSFGAVIVGSGDAHNAVYMINLLRHDKREQAVDQQPFAIAYRNVEGVIDLTAAVLHHGDWPGRTTYPGDGFIGAVEGSGITNFYPYIGVPNKEQGSITELEPDSQKKAFWNTVKAIRGESTERQE